MRYIQRDGKLVQTETTPAQAPPTGPTATVASTDDTVEPLPELPRPHDPRRVAAILDALSRQACEQSTRVEDLWERVREDMLRESGD